MGDNKLSDKMLGGGGGGKEGEGRKRGGGQGVMEYHLI